MTPYEHPDYLAQLAGILAHPEDDLPRLVLADWLDEHGEPERAAEIRMPCVPADELYGLSARARKWRRITKQQMGSSIPKSSTIMIDPPARHKEGGEGVGDWLSHSAAMMISRTIVVNFRRGFVSGIGWRMPQLVRYLPRLVRVCPVSQAYPTGMYFDRERMHPVNHVS